MEAITHNHTVSPTKLREYESKFNQERSMNFSLASEYKDYDIRKNELLLEMAQQPKASPKKASPPKVNAANEKSSWFE